MTIRIERAQAERIRAYVADAAAAYDAAHDMAHIDRVVRLAARICAGCPAADPALVEAIALLHEACDDKLSGAREIALLRAFLADLLGADAADRLLSFVELISFRKHPRLAEGAPLEVRIVQDADRIDAIGAVGVARAFAYGGSKGRPLYGAGEGGSTLAHFEEKLLRLYDCLNTDAAREIARPRHDFLVSFYRQLLSEVGQTDD